MGKHHLSSIIILVILSLPNDSPAQLSGALSGTCGPGSFDIIGNISVGNGDSLILVPGTIFNFTWSYTFIINGYIHAAGNENDSIKFLRSGTSFNWGGIGFNDNSDDSGRLEYCHISGSSLGGIHIEDSNPVISNCTINGNAGNGGIKIDGSSPSIINCDISANSTNLQGGGIYLKNSNAYIDGCTIGNNAAFAGGGGIAVDENSLPLIINSNISGNSANQNGGGIESQISCTPTILNCVINDNTADGYGGGIYVGDQYSVITGCTIEGNYSAAEGGGIYFREYFETISYCTIAENEALSLGGGIIFHASFAGIQNCTFYSNNCINGSGDAVEVWDSGNIIIFNTIFSGHHSHAAIHQYGSPVSINYCDFFDNPAGNYAGNPAIPGFEELTMVNLNGDSCDCYMNIFENPLFIDPQNLDFHLSNNSPCIDAGDPLSLPDPDGTVADIGAYYFDQSVLIEELISPLPPQKFFFHPPYPNPFNSSAVISFELRHAGFVRVAVYDVTGKELLVLSEGYLPEGIYRTVFDGSDIASGVYFARLQAGESSLIQKILLIK